MQPTLMKIGVTSKIELAFPLACYCLGPLPGLFQPSARLLGHCRHGFA